MEQEAMASYPHAPYTLPYVYMGKGKSEQYVRLSWFDRSSGTYVPEKVRLGVKGLPWAKKRDLLHDLCDKLKEVVKLRNAQGLYHDDSTIDFGGPKPYPDAPVLDLFVKFRDDLDNPEFQRDSASVLVTRWSEFPEQNLELVPLLPKLNLSIIPKAAILAYPKLQYLHMSNICRGWN